MVRLILSVSNVILLLRSSAEQDQQDQQRGPVHLLARVLPVPSAQTSGRGQVRQLGLQLR